MIEVKCIHYKEIIFYFNNTITILMECVEGIELWLKWVHPKFTAKLSFAII